MSRSRQMGDWLLLSLTVVLTGTSGLAADPVKVGPEIAVGGEGSADTPRVASDPAGNFIVAWQDTSDGIVEAAAFWATGNSQGPVFPMSSTASDIWVTGGPFDADELLSIAADKAGNFVVAYNAYDTNIGYYAYYGACYLSPCIWTKRRNANGTIAPANFVVGDPRINTYSSAPYYYNQTANPELAADGEGNFIVAWEGYDLSTSGYVDSEGVWARRLVGAGQINGNQFRVNENTDDYQGDEGQLDVSADDVGNFAIVWRDDNVTDPPYGGIVLRRFDKAKNPLGPQMQVDPDGRDPHVAQLPDGTAMVVWEDSGVNGRVYDDLGAPIGPAFQISATGEYPEIGASPAGFVVVYEVPGFDAAGRTFDSLGVPTSGEFSVNTVSDAFGPQVAAAADGNFVVAWQDGGYAYAQQFQVAPPATQQALVLGKVAILQNKDPDDFEKSSGKWGARGANIEVPLRGSTSDPRCNGDPEGTVKASVRFVSATSGQDHAIDLPCQKWTATGGDKVGSVPKRGYKYSDGLRALGPCTSVKITGTKSLSVTCKGKSGVAAFPFDLVPGQSQGVVQAVLQLGLFEYCAEFQPFLDGSDGKKYQGKAFAAPASCP